MAIVTTPIMTDATGKAIVNAIMASSVVPVEETIADDGAVSQQLNANTMYHFTGALTALTITFATASGIAHYHFDFDSGATAPTLSLPQDIVMPKDFSVAANFHYEIDILNNYGVASTWTIS